MTDYTSVQRLFVSRQRRVTSPALLIVFGTAISLAFPGGPRIGTATDSVFQSVQPAGGSFFRPREAESLAVTPPGFSWWQADKSGKVRYTADALKCSVQSALSLQKARRQLDKGKCLRHTS